MKNVVKNVAELSENLAQGVEEGYWIAYVDDGQVCFKRPSHATVDELRNRLTADETRTILRMEEQWNE